MEVIISKSSNTKKKYMARIDNKTIHFGDSMYNDYTTHHDETRKENYIARHSKENNKNISNVASAAFLSRNILWNKSTTRQSIHSLNKKYKDVKFIYN